MSYFADEDVYQRFEKHNDVLSFIYCHGICVYIVFSLLIAWLMRLAIILPAEVSWKRNKMKDFCVVFRCNRVESKMPGSSAVELFFPPFFLFPFFVLLFSINI